MPYTRPQAAILAARLAEPRRFIHAVAGSRQAGGAILVEGRDQLDLPPGTEVTITATGQRYR